MQLENSTTSLLPKKKQRSYSSLLAVFSIFTFLSLGSLAFFASKGYIFHALNEVHIGNSRTQRTEDFQFFKDNQERYGWWNSCAENGECATQMRSKWTPPVTMEGGMVLLIQKPNRMLKFKFKLFAPTHTWRKAQDGESGYVTVIGVDKHVYGLTENALAALIKLRGIYKSGVWRTLLDPLLPQGVTFSPISSELRGRGRLKPIIEMDESILPPAPNAAKPILVTVLYGSDGLLKWDIVVDQRTKFTQIFVPTRNVVVGNRCIMRLVDKAGKSKDFAWGAIKTQNIFSLFPNIEKIVIIG